MSTKFTNNQQIINNVATGFFDEPPTDPTLLKKAIEWHDNVTAGYKLVKRSSEKEIVEMYVILKKTS